MAPSTDRPVKIKKIHILVLISGFLALLYNCSGNPDQPEKKEEQKDSLTWLNHSDTAHYVGINTCRLCHQDIYNTFIKTGMGKSFDHATVQKTSAKFDHPVIYDKYSDFYYKAFWQRDSLKFLEFRLEGKDTVYKRTERVDYIVGSGHHTNSHIQSVNGYLNQMPMTFYTQKGEWHLPPGFEDGHNSRFRRKIGLECMSCHNAYPDFVEGSENKYDSVPQGIDCERCHGPGSIHVQQRSTGSRIDTSKYIDYSIVNPAKLSIDLQFDLCQRCHLQGNAVLKEGKSFYDFKPGMKLSNYISVFLPKYKNADDEFIMASHADRLKQSQCFIKTFESARNSKSLRPYKEALTCVTCHNPHISVRETNKEVFNDACKNCHNPAGKSQLECSDKNVMAARKAAPGHAPSDLLNCVGCHMPKSGSIDIPHVTVHDHYIRKPVTKKEKEKIKEFIGLFSINEKDPDKLTKARAYINQYEKFEWKSYYLDSAQRLLPAKTREDIDKNIEALVQLYFIKNDFAKVVEYQKALGTDYLLSKRLTAKSYSNDNAWTCYRIAESLQHAGEPDVSLRFLVQANNLAPYNPEFKDKMANAYAQKGNNRLARKFYEEVLKENPKFVNSISNLGFLNLSEGKTEEAERLYKLGLSYDPDYEPLLMNMAGLLNYKGDFKGAAALIKKVLKKNPGNPQAKTALEQLAKVHG